VDQTLYELDLALFGFEPAMALEAWVTPVTTEWFSFFYFSYFLLLSLHIWPVLILCRQQQLMGEFCLGMLGMFCVGHVLKRHGFSAAPIIMGLVLGSMVENTLKQSLIIFDHNWLRFLERPIVVTFLLLTLVSIATPLISRWLARARATGEAPSSA
jgi:putative tricarboxylic transport membrane protein